MSNDVGLGSKPSGRFTASSVERLGWGIFVVAMGVLFYAEELNRIRDAWDQISLIGGSFLIVYWFVARAIGRSLSNGMLVVGGVLVTFWVINKYHLSLEVWPLIIIVIGVMLIVKAFADKRE